jgi:hypothetical protein
LITDLTFKTPITKEFKKLTVKCNTIQVKLEPETQKDSKSSWQETPETFFLDKFGATTFKAKIFKVFELNHPAGDYQT